MRKTLLALLATAGFPVGAHAQLNHDYPYTLTEQDRTAVRSCINEVVTQGPLANDRDHYVRCLLRQAGIVQDQWQSSAQTSALFQMAKGRCGLYPGHETDLYTSPAYSACLKTEGQKIFESIGYALSAYGDSYMTTWMDDLCAHPQWASTSACLNYRAEKTSHQ